MQDNIPHVKHSALFYNSQEELLSFLIPYFKKGIEENEFCLWVVPENTQPKDAALALSKTMADLDYRMKIGQVIIGDYKTLYFKDRVFSAMDFMQSLREKEKDALQKGFTGIRAAGDCNWALENHWFNFLLYEVELEKSIDSLKFKALCSYSSNRLNMKKIVTIGVNHHSSIVNRVGQWVELEPEYFKEIA